MRICTLARTRRTGCAAATRILALVALSAAAAGMSATPAQAKWRYVNAWGSVGSGRGQFGTGRQLVGGDRQFDDPAGLALDGHGHLYVADPSNNRIQTFSLQGSSLGAFGRFGFARGPFDAFGRLDLPEGIALASGNALAVSDNRNDRVQVLSTRGRAKAAMGGRGALSGQMVSPMGLAVRNGTIYVVDQGSYRVDRFSLSGRYRGAFGHFGKSGCGFGFPYGLAINRRGNVFVADSRRQRVMEFTSAGRCVRTLGGAGTGPGRFTHPTGVAVEPSGQVLVVDDYNQAPPRDRSGLGGCVQRFTATGRYVESFGESHLQSPTYIAAGSNGNVYVSDLHRVVRFANDTPGSGSDDPCGSAAGDQGPPPDDTGPSFRSVRRPTR
jgi:tripartite motif-containing protein 71